MSLVLEGNKWATILLVCIERANSIIDMNSSDILMGKLFVKDVILCLSNQVFKAKFNQKKKKGKHDLPSEQATYDVVHACYTRLRAKGVAVMVGDLSINSQYNYSYAQAHTESDVIHVSLQWMSAAQNAFLADSSSRKARRHQAVLTVKLLTEYIQLYSKTLVQFFYAVNGVGITSSRVGLNDESICDMDCSGEEVLIKHCLLLQYPVPETNTFDATSPLALIDPKRTVWQFASVEASDAFVDSLLTSVLDQNSNYCAQFTPPADALIRVKVKRGGSKKRKDLLADSICFTASKISKKRKQCDAGDADSVSSDDPTWSWRHKAPATGGSRKS